VNRPAAPSRRLTKTMKILFVVPNPPSLVRVRPYNLIKRLAERGHQVTLATLWSNAEEHQDIERLQNEGFPVLAVPLRKEQILWNLLNAVARGAPLQAYYASTPALRGLLKQNVNGTNGVHGKSKPHFNLVHVEHLRGAQYGIYLKGLLAGHPVPVVWDSVDCISHLFEQTATRSRSLMGRIMARLELNRTKQYESAMVKHFDQILVTSDTDKRALGALAPSTPGTQGREAPITVLPNGVDLEYFSCNGFTANGNGREPATILFSGKMSYHANLTSALYLIQEIMPRIWRHRPEARVVIAGKDPPPELCKLGRSQPNVEITGTVPDLRPYLHAATVAVSPVVYGAGIQNKVLEAMACGTPVIASTQAASALRTVEGNDLLLADSTEAFVRHVLDLLADRTLQQNLSLHGRSYVEKHHNWSRISRDLDELYTQVIERKHTL
jgi:polysaccharide biosynthesis protein PslH